MVYMHSLRISLLFSLLFSVFSVLSADNHAEHVDIWSSKLTQQLSPQELQLAANIMYLLYANSIIEAKTRQFIIPITRLNQVIRLNIVEYKDATQELATLKTLLDRLSHVIGARNVYNQMLQTCLNYYNSHSSLLLTQAILELQAYGQESIKNYAPAVHAHVADYLKSSAEILASGVQPLSDIAKIHEAVANKTLTQQLRDQEQDYADIIAIDELQKNNFVATKNIMHALNAIDNTTESLSMLILFASDIYKQHYTALYNHLTSDTFDQSCRNIMFGIADVLPDEYKTALPHPDNVFEHVLQTIKMYTQVELIQ